MTQKIRSNKYILQTAINGYKKYITQHYYMTSQLHFSFCIKMSQF